MVSSSHFLQACVLASAVVAGTCQADNDDPNANWRNLGFGGVDATVTVSHLHEASEWNATLQLQGYKSGGERNGWLMHSVYNGSVLAMAASRSTVYTLYADGSLIGVGYNGERRWAAMVQNVGGIQGMALTRDAVWLRYSGLLVALLVRDPRGQTSQTVLLPSGVDVRLFATDSESQALAFVGTNGRVYFANAAPELMGAGFNEVSLRGSVLVSEIFSMEVRQLGAQAGLLVVTRRGSLVAFTIPLDSPVPLGPSGEATFRYRIDSVTSYSYPREEVIFPYTQRWAITGDKRDYVTMCVWNPRTGDDSVAVVAVDDMWTNSTISMRSISRTRIAGIDARTTTGAVRLDGGRSKWHAYVFQRGVMYVDEIAEDGSTTNAWLRFVFICAISGVVFVTVSKLCLVIPWLIGRNEQNDSDSDGNAPYGGRGDAEEPNTPVAAMYARTYFPGASGDCIPDPPHEFLCPITLAIMYDPVRCGNQRHTFERVALVRHVKQRGECPVCRGAMTLGDVERDVALERRIIAYLQHYKAEHPDVPIEIPQKLSCGIMSVNARFCDADWASDCPIAVDPADTAALLKKVHAALELPRDIEDHDVVVTAGNAEEVRLAAPAAPLSAVGILGACEEVEVRLKLKFVAREQLRLRGIADAGSAEAAVAAAWGRTPRGDGVWEMVRLVASAGYSSLGEYLHEAVAQGNLDSTDSPSARARTPTGRTTGAYPR